MIAFPLSEAVLACQGKFHGDAALLDQPVTDVCIDSRKAAPHALYVPIIGQIHDGHRFIPAAMEQGALAVLSDRPLTPAGYLYEDRAESFLKEFTAEASHCELT